MSNRRRARLQTTVYLDAEQVVALAELSKRTGVPQAVYIRAAIDDVLRRAALETPPARKVA